MLQSIKLKLQFGQLNITTNKAVSLRIDCFFLTKISDWSDFYEIPQVGGEC